MFIRLSIFQEILQINQTIDLSKQQKLDADPKAIHQIYFIGNLDGAGAAMFFIIVDFSKGTVKVLRFYFIIIKY